MKLHGIVLSFIFLPGGISVFFLAGILYAIRGIFSTGFFASGSDAAAALPGRSLGRRHNDVPAGRTNKLFLFVTPGTSRPRTPRVLFPRGKSTQKRAGTHGPGPPFKLRGVFVLRSSCGLSGLNRAAGTCIERSGCSRMLSAVPTALLWVLPAAVRTNSTSGAAEKSTDRTCG